jgi:hypothetical protein
MKNGPDRINRIHMIFAQAPEEPEQQLPLSAEINVSARRAIRSVPFFRKGTKI